MRILKYVKLMRILKYVKFDVKNTWAEKLNSDCLRGRSWSCGSVDALFGILVIDFALHRKKIKTQKNYIRKVLCVRATFSEVCSSIFDVLF